VKLGVPDAHLTDVIKRRGESSESCNKLPPDFSVHLDLLRREIDIIQPSRIVVLGYCAEKLLLDHLPDVREKVRRVWHFAYGARGSNAAVFEKQMRAAIYDEGSNDALPPSDFSEKQRTRRGKSTGAQRLHSYARVRTSGTLSLICDPCPNYQPRGARGAGLWKLARDFAAAGETFQAATNRTGLPKDYLQYFIEKGGIAVDGLTGEAAYANFREC
jgi:hypothetical protein